MATKQKASQNKFSLFLSSFGAWVMALATLIGLTQHDERRQVIVNTVRPVYAYVDEDGSNVFNRNDNENETVHLPTKFDIGLHVTAVGGRK